MSKRLITISNEYNYHSWMRQINEVLAKENARVVTITALDKDYLKATAWIEIDDTKAEETTKRKPIRSRRAGIGI